MANQFRYTAVFELAEEGGYIVTFPAIPGLATQGETMDEARAMAADCLRAYLESLRKDGEHLPPTSSHGSFDALVANSVKRRGAARRDMLPLR